MTEVGETASIVDNLIQDANDFEKLCNCDLDTASSVIEDGRYLKTNLTPHRAMFFLLSYSTR